MQQTVPYMSAREASRVWDISQRRVAILCSEGRIADSTMIGKMWLIPKDAKKPIDARNLRKKVEPVKPFIKWAGGKGQLLSEIISRIPNEFGRTMNKYAEPFVGGGALLFEVLQKYSLKEVYISDINTALIMAYIQIKENLDELIKRLQRLQDEFLPLDTEQRKVYYYQKREIFNRLNNGIQSDDVELAALMIFINKTCFNGLYRVNRKNQYNVPMGDYKNPTICDEKNLRAVSRLLKGVKIVAGDYKQSENFADSNTLVYFDPPYRPLTKTSEFTAYTENGFNDEEQKELAKYAEKLTFKGAKVILSNSDPKNKDDNDNFFDELYSKFKVCRVQANRMINSSADKRGKITELLVTNF